MIESMAISLRSMSGISNAIIRQSDSIGNFYAAATMTAVGKRRTGMSDGINRKALARLDKALPEVFPAPALTHAMGRRFAPPRPRLAIDSYWRAHPVRADRLARAVAAKSGGPAGWTWRLADEKPDRVRRRGRKTDDEKPDWLMWSFRVPPAPYRERNYALGPGFCRICGQPVYGLGWHVDLWGRGANRNAIWHAACVVAWDMWMAPSDYARVLKRLQQRRSAQTGGRLWKTAEVDHRSRCSGCGASTATRSGYHRSASGAYRTCRSSIATCIREMRRGSTVPSHGRGRRRADGRSLMGDPAVGPDLASQGCRPWLAALFVLKTKINSENPAPAPGHAVAS
jgi:hypothetical protein